ncbi:acyl-CoA dehydrogenase family protein [Modestobacter sp. NPDC049651]|uniref:acyl-CoA dehydrogenase family protein n=1 Tax=unclassified Modestobacter TaxID=2643866 RepID=UPI0033D451E1
MAVPIPPAHLAFRDELREWLARHLPPGGLPDVDTVDGFRAHQAWERTLHAAGYTGISWPREHGGAGGDLLHEAVFAEEYERARGPVRITRPSLRFLGPTLMRFGTPDQQQRWLLRMLRAEDVWSQGFSEPEAGSDLAGVRTRAVRQGDGYLVEGQKTWTTYGRFSDWMFALVRTGAPGDRHRGLTCLAVDLHSPGVEVRPVRQVHGRTGFAEVFFSGVRVPADQRIGAEGEGWAVAMTLLSFERGPDAAGPVRSEQRLSALAADVLADLPPDDVAGVRRELGEAAARVYAYRSHTARRLADQWSGEPAGAESSLVKLFSSQLDLDLVTLGADLFGDARLAEGTPEHLDLWHSRAGRVYGGTAEVQRTVVADRVLGLPR